MNKKQVNRYNAGFTIVEIVIVIFVLAIISVTAMSRFNDANAFTGFIVRDQIISQARRAQQGSFGRSGMTMVFTPNVAGTEATIAVLDGAATLSTATVSIESLTLTGDIDETASCTSTAGSSITSSNPFTLTFGELGDLVASSGVASTANFGLPTTAARVCINQDIAYSVCVSPAGFAYVGDCDV